MNQQVSLIQTQKSNIIMFQDKYIRYGPKSNDFSNPIYDAEYNRSIQDMEKFWEDKARDVAWSKFPEKILDASDQYLHRWYPDG
jgi:hypothetical protein